MAKRFTFDNSADAISLDEYIAYCDEHLDPEDVDSVLAGADKLHALSRNRTFLIDRLNDYFKHAGELEEVNSYSAQALLLTIRPGYVLRTNTWVKPTIYAGSDSWERQLYSYDYAHNHNFNLLTVGYLGSGYFTDLYRLPNPDKIVGYLGEKVDMESSGRLQLGLGDVLLYERMTDVHIQRAPEDLSISINLMPLDRNISLTGQYAFDVNEKTISALVGSQIAQQVDLLRMAGCIGNDQTMDVILHVARTHPNQNTRLGALRAACMLRPEESERIWNDAMNDKSEMVRMATGKVMLSEAPMMV